MQDAYEPLRERLRTLVQEAGYILVEAKFFQKKASVRAYIIIYSDSGIGTDDCGAIYWKTQPALLEWFHCDEEHLYVEVSSPGLERVFKSQEEYAIFKGKIIKIIKNDGLVVIGKLLGADATQVMVQTGNEELKLQFDAIAKTSLFSDYNEK